MYYLCEFGFYGKVTANEVQWVRNHLDATPLKDKADGDGLISLFNLSPFVEVVYREFMGTLTLARYRLIRLLFAKDDARFTVKGHSYILQSIERESNCGTTFNVTARDCRNNIIKFFIRVEDEVYAS